MDTAPNTQKLNFVIPFETKVGIPKKKGSPSNECAKHCLISLFSGGNTKLTANFGFVIPFKASV